MLKQLFLFLPLSLTFPVKNIFHQIMTVKIEYRYRYLSQKELLGAGVRSKNRLWLRQKKTGHGSTTLVQIFKYLACPCDSTFSAYLVLGEQVPVPVNNYRYIIPVPVRGGLRIGEIEDNYRNRLFLYGGCCFYLFFSIARRIK